MHFFSVQIKILLRLKITSKQNKFIGVGGIVCIDKPPQSNKDLNRIRNQIVKTSGSSCSKGGGGRRGIQRINLYPVDKCKQNLLFTIHRIQIYWSFKEKTACRNIFRNSSSKHFTTYLLNRSSFKILSGFATEKLSLQHLQQVQ